MNQNEFAARRQKLMKQIGEQGIAIIPAAHVKLRNGDSDYLFRQNSDFYYLTGFNEPDAIAVLLPKRKQGEYILFNRPKDALAETWTGIRVGQEKAKTEYGADEAFPLAALDEKMPDLLKNRHAVYFPIGTDPLFDQQIMNWANKLNAQLRSGITAPTEFISLGNLVHEMRLHKSPVEINLMKKVAEISALAHCRAMAACQPGMMEYQLEAEILYVLTQHDCFPPAYNCIVGGGANACVLHYVENKSQLKSGDLVLVDAAGEYQNYAADITRTYPINGVFSAEQRAIYELVLQTQKAVIKLIKPGLQWNDLQDLAIRMITEGLLRLKILKGTLEKALSDKLFLQFYMHNIGHWLGLDVHDPSPYKVNNKWRVLEPGMVFTVEPGIYISTPKNVDKKWWNIGVRIEDDILVTEKGAEILTHHVPKEIAEIEAMMHSDTVCF